MIKKRRDLFGNDRCGFEKSVRNMAVVPRGEIGEKEEDIFIIGRPRDTHLLPYKKVILMTQ